MPLQIIRQDITRMEVDAIVNPSNRGMIGYSGVDLAVHRAAGKELDRECRRIAPVEKGEAVVTDGYKLPCRYIIHTSGPVWKGGDGHEEELLEKCYISCLSKASELGCEEVAFPLISSGGYGCPKEIALNIAVRSITGFLMEHEMTVYLCVFDKRSYELSKNLICEVKEYIDDRYVNTDDIRVDSDYGSTVQPKARRLVFQKSCRKEASVAAPQMSACNAVCEDAAAPEFPDLESRIKKLDKSFAETLFSLIDEKGMTDVECYKRANVSRKTFSKIRCDSQYRPSKETVLAFAIALKLTLDETNALLKTAGYALSHCYKSDVIIEYFIMKGKYDIFEINEALFEFDQVCLGC